jgi:hypothetical protein
MKVIFSSGATVIGSIDGWEGPVPSEGDFIVRPLPENSHVTDKDMMPVLNVSWRVLNVPGRNGIAGPLADPYVVVTI